MVKGDMMRIEKRMVQRWAVAMAWLLLTAARQAAAPLPDMLLPAEPAHPIGMPFTAKPGDEILRAQIVKATVVKLDVPFKASLDRFAHDFQPGEQLTPVLLRPEKRGDVKMIFCGPDQRAISKFAAVMIGDWASKFEKIVRFCFEDQNNDGKFEGFILAGAKDPALQAVNAITPIAYSQSDMVPYDNASALSLVYRKFVPETRKLVFDLKMTVDGKVQRFDYINSMPKGVMQEDRPTYQTNPQKIPYPVHFDNIVGANLGVNKVDGDGHAEMVINSDFKPTLIKPVDIQMQMIYIYVYR